MRTDAATKDAIASQDTTVLSRPTNLKMMLKHNCALVAIAAWLTVPVVASPLHEGFAFRGPFEVSTDAVHNAHVHIKDTLRGLVKVVYGSCDINSHAHAHHELGDIELDGGRCPDRLVWIVPESAQSGGCLHAFQDGQLIGRSPSIQIGKNLRKRQSIADVADTSGPWFDGVAYMQSKNQTSAFAAEAKSKKIAIIGGGMSGLLTSLLLQSVGVEDWHIHESSYRVGGRIRTRYLNGSAPGDYQYQEMGPMRFPVSIQYSDTNETLEIQDHKMVFQLGETLNKLNNYNPEVAVNFIPWIQSSANTPISSYGVRLENGQVPSKADVAANETLGGVEALSEDPDAVEAAQEEYSDFVDLDEEMIKLLASNIFQGHKQAIEDGDFHFSETSYLRYQLGLDNNLTDYIAGSDDSPIWASSMYENVYFGATTWKTIDKGLESLPRAFMPLVKDKLTFGRKVTGLAYNDTSDTITVNWRDNGSLALEPDGSEGYDYAVVSAPFTKVRAWYPIPQYSSSLSRAISTMNYETSCKVALLYKTRFWESLDPPIIGGCGSTDIPGIGSICYPSYDINGTGPGVILASYISGTMCRTMAAMSETDHIAYVQRAMVEVHGPVAAEQYTGIFNRQLWETDEHQAGAWASPSLGQQDLYLPAYYQTEFKTIFIGEHTSYTHAWIFSALDSAVRGTTQLLLDLGLVDEAKHIVNEWMGRWISI